MTVQKCPLCGQAALAEHKGTYRLEPPPNIPGGTIVIHDTSWLHCASCQEDILPVELEAAMNRQRYQRLGLLLPEEIRRIRAQTGLSTRDMSNLLDVPEETYRRWETGHSLPTEAGSALLRRVDQDASAEHLLRLGNYRELLELLAELRRCRERLGLSLARVMERSGMDKATLSRLENGRYENPTVETLTRYAAALGKRIKWSVEDLLPTQKES